VGRNGSAVFSGGEVRGSTDYVSDKEIHAWKQDLECGVDNANAQIYGFGTAYFEGTTLASRGIGGGITAWKGSTQWCERQIVVAPGVCVVASVLTVRLDGPNTFGVYFRDSKIVAAPDPIPNVTLTHNCALGRPWNNQSRVVYMDTDMVSDELASRRFGDRRTPLSWS
jgi:hypothetical protein